MPTFRKLQSFAYAVKSKDSDFLSNVHALCIACDQRYRKPLWIPLEQENESYSSELESLLSGLRNLKKIGLTSEWFKILPKVTSSASIRDITVINPVRPGTYDKIHACLRRLPLHSLHLINPSFEFLKVEDTEDAVAYLRKIPRLSIEFTDSPSQHPVRYMRTLATLLTGPEDGQTRHAADSLTTDEKRSLLLKYCPLFIQAPSRVITRPTVIDDTRIEQVKASWSQAISIYKARGPPNRPVRLDSVYLSEEEAQWYTGLTFDEEYRRKVKYKRRAGDEAS